MRHFKTILFFLCSCAFGATPQGVVDCNIIFEQRKAEILDRIQKIDEQQQALQALQSANQAVLDQRESSLEAKEREINATMEAITLKQTKIERLIAQNEEILRLIKQAKDDKISATYTNIKDSKAAPIIEQLDNAEAATILFSLDSKVSSKILSKMTPARAAELTQLLQKGPPFKPDVELAEPATAATPTLSPLAPKVPGQGGGAI
ncbi:MAG: MotE family protein [Helicobacter sp.]|nr:MotE family protein [Helicobacter sp.]